MDIQNARISTAGAYICINGLFVFAIGARPHNGNIPVVRLGGHLEEHETGWQCAVREVYEESGLEIQAVVPPRTFLADRDCINADLDEMRWEHRAEEPDPLLISAYRRESGISLSLMYLAEAAGPAEPSSEVKGLLLLEEAEVHWLCHESVTLENYVSSGGEAILDHPFDYSMILEPFAQLRLLSRILCQIADLYHAVTIPN